MVASGDAPHDAIFAKGRLVAKAKASYSSIVSFLLFIRSNSLFLLGKTADRLPKKKIRLQFSQRRGWPLPSTAPASQRSPLSAPDQSHRSPHLPTRLWRSSSPRLLLSLPGAGSVSWGLRPGGASSSPPGCGQTQRPHAPHRGLRHPGRGGAFPCEFMGFVVFNPS